MGGGSPHLWGNITIEESPRSYKKTNLISSLAETGARPAGYFPCSSNTLGADIACHQSANKKESRPDGKDEKFRRIEKRRKFNTKVLPAMMTTSTPQTPSDWAPPVLVTSPLTLSVQVGGEIFLPCFVSRLGDCLPTWQHSGRVLSVGKFLVRKDGRLRVTSYYGLVISDVRPDDKGPYLCQVDYRGYVQEVQHRIVVLQPPVVEKQPNLPVIVVGEGEELTLRCAASGYPNPIITWWREGSLVQLGEGLSLEMVMDRDMEGEYMCRAENGIGQPSNQTFLVNVFCEFAISISISPLLHANNRELL